MPEWACGAFNIAKRHQGKPSGAALRGFCKSLKIKLVSPTQLNVTVSLTVETTPKAGKINGRIQLQGKKTAEDTWTLLDGAVTPNFIDFTGGSATYSFTIPAGGYAFFQPLIVP